MNSPNDEELMAFADGELDAAEHRKIEALISADAAIAERYKVFAETKEPIARLFAERASEAVPGSIVALVRSYDDRRQVEDNAASQPSGLVRRVSEFFGSVSQALTGPQFVLAGVAGGFLLGIGAATFAPFSSAVPGTDEGGHLIGMHAPASQLGRLLESKPSGTTVQLAGDGRASTLFKAVLSFRNRDGGYCRQYLLQRSDGKASQGVACRLPDRGWSDRIRVAAEVKQTTGFKPASNGGNQQIDTVVDRLIEGDAVGKQDEVKLISQGWRTN